MWLGWAVFFTNFRHCWMTATALTWLACAVFFRLPWIVNDSHSIDMTCPCCVFQAPLNDSHSIDMTCPCCVFQAPLNDNHSIDMTCLCSVLCFSGTTEWQPQHWHDLPVQCAVFFRRCWMTATALTLLACAVFFRHHWIVNDSHSIDMTCLCYVFQAPRLNDNHSIDMTCLCSVLCFSGIAIAEWQPQHWHDLPELCFSGTTEWQPQHWHDLPVQCAVFFRHCWMTATALTWLACAVVFRQHWMTTTALTWLACAMFFRLRWIVNDSHGIDMTCLCYVFQAPLNSEWQPQHWHDLAVLWFSGTTE